MEQVAWQMTKRERLVYELGLAAFEYAKWGTSSSSLRYSQCVGVLQHYDDNVSPYEDYTGPTDCDLT